MSPAEVAANNHKFFKNLEGAMQWVYLVNLAEISLGSYAWC